MHLQARRYSRSLPAEVLRKLDGHGDFPNKANIEAWLSRLFEDFTIEFIAIFGSIARGQATQASDLDVFVVASDFPEHPLRRHDVLNRYLIPNIDARPHTPAEFRQMVENWDLTVLEVFYDHWFLYDPTGYGERAFETFSALRQQDKLIREDFAWIVNI